MSAVLLVLCQPWLVALPLQGVVRVIEADAAAISDGIAHIGDEAWPVRSLPAALGLGDRPPVALVLLRTGDARAALATGRCLNVGALPGAAIRLPAAAARSHRATTAFPAGRFAAEHGLAPFGLLLDPTELLAAPAAQPA